MSRNTFIGLLVAIILLAGGFWLFSKKGSNGTSQTNTQPSQHIEIEGSSGVVLIEYGDFQCPACGQYYPILKQLRVQYAGKVTFQFRNFPIVQSHPNAMAAHRAAEAAGKQGKFFEMHDLLYETQTSWTDSKSVQPIFENFAMQLGLDIEKYKADLASSEVANTINADIKEGVAIGADSTPTFVLDGKKIENPRSFDDFVKLIDDAIRNKTGQ